MGGSTRFKPPEHWKSPLFPPRFRVSREPEQTQGSARARSSVRFSGIGQEERQNSRSIKNIDLTHWRTKISKVISLFVKLVKKQNTCTENRIEYILNPNHLKELFVAKTAPGITLKIH